MHIDWEMCTFPSPLMNYVHILQAQKKAKAIFRNLMRETYVLDGGELMSVFVESTSHFAVPSEGGKIGMLEMGAGRFERS